MLDTSIQVKTDQFDGPLGLLLLLIEKEEMDVKSLDLTLITKQYLDYLADMKALNFDIAGDYLYLAATLILLKSKTVLSETDLSGLNEELGEFAEGLEFSSQENLIRRLEELQKYQALSERLWQIPKLNHEVFIRPKINRKEIINSLLSPMDLEKLTMSMVDLLKKEKRKFSIVRKDRLSIKDKLIFLKKTLKKGDHHTLDKILEDSPMVGEDNGIINLVITFISLLELARLQKVRIFQNEHGSQIYFDVIDSLENFDVDLANGFDDENPEEEDQIPLSLDEPVYSDGDPQLIQ